MNEKMPSVFFLFFSSTVVSCRLWTAQAFCGVRSPPSGRVVELQVLKKLQHMAKTAHLVITT